MYKLKNDGTISNDDFAFIQLPFEDPNKIEYVRSSFVLPGESLVVCPEAAFVKKV